MRTSTLHMWTIYLLFFKNQGHITALRGPPSRMFKIVHFSYSFRDSIFGGATITTYTL